MQSVKTIEKHVVGFEETLNEIKNIKAGNNVNRWLIYSYVSEPSEELGEELVFIIDINRRDETRRKYNDYVYTMTIKFEFNKTQYTAYYKDIYLAKLIRENFEIIKTRLKQSHKSGKRRLQ